VSLIDEWVEKAEADYEGAVALNRRRAAPLPISFAFTASNVSRSI